MSRQINDVLKGANGDLLTGATVRFLALATGYDGATTPRGSSAAVTSDGTTAAIDVTLQNGVYQVFLAPSGGDEVYLGKATVTDGAATTLAVVLGATEAVTSALLAAIDDAIAAHEAAADPHPQYVQSEDVEEIVVLTQAEYDALGTPDPVTLYVVSG